MTLYIISQVLVALGMIADLTSRLMKKKANLLVISVGASLLYAASYVCLGQYVAVLASAVYTIRNFIYLFLDKKSVHLKYYYITASILIALFVTSVALLWTGPLDLFPLMCMILVTVGLISKNTFIVRLVLIANSMIWVLYNLLIGAYVNMACDFLNALITCYALWRYNLRKENKATKKIILASNNEHKIKEFKEILTGCEILALKDIGFEGDIEENGNNFFENSMIKAQTVSKFLKEKGIVASVIADDSGLVVPAINFEPGIYSARYAGDHDSAKNREKVLKNLKGIEDRKAYFNCALVELYPDGTYIKAEGRTYGRITQEEIGDKSFGYDCLFLSDELNKTFGEASAEEKNKVSHRARAIKELKVLRNKKQKEYKKLKQAK